MSTLLMVFGFILTLGGLAMGPLAVVSCASGLAVIGIGYLIDIQRKVLERLEETRTLP